jgi:Segregation and condensation complex subunit ScpB
VERIRGVDSDYTIRSLLHRRLIVELGRSETPGRPYLYGTSLDFLERFGLTSLEQLPPLEVDIAARLAEEGADVAPILEVAAPADPPAIETPTDRTPPDEAPGADGTPPRGPSTDDVPTTEDG